ncbi:unnamed protein product [Anisakis simplex]|uniref:Uncharacterized protein n=1 Tax=Anisakis simplex TaxID=6269 RepID=A0A0M3JGF9_ANISI|nr:unnamed protein product [Anisakis simplex]
MRPGLVRRINVVMKCQIRRRHPKISRHKQLIGLMCSLMKLIF